MSHGISRRGLLKALGVGAGAALGTRLGGGALGSFIGDAHAATNGSAVVVLHLVGGFNSLFVSADSFASAGTFGVAAGNYTALGDGVAIDNTWNTALSTWSKDHLAVLGVRHGISSHGFAKSTEWSHSDGSNAALVLANAIGGSAPIKAAVAGSDLDSSVPGGAVNGTSFQRVNDLLSTADVVGIPSGDPRRPDRALARAGLMRAQTMARTDLTSNPKRLVGVDRGYTTSIETLATPTLTGFTLSQVTNGYNLGTSTFVSSLNSKFAAAELMIRAGTNVVSIFDFGGWDSHGDTAGTSVRNAMSSYVMGPVANFINRMVDPAMNPTQNVTLLVLGDFARSLPGSDHQPNVSVAVIGRNVKRGTTGKVADNVSLPDGTPSVAGMWSYLAAVSKVATNPFGVNPHGLVL